MCLCFSQQKMFAKLDLFLCFMFYSMNKLIKKMQVNSDSLSHLCSSVTNIICQNIFSPLLSLFSLIF